MQKAAQHKLALSMAAVALLAFAAVLYLVFLFPKLVAIWIEQGQVLSTIERFLWRLSGLCQSYGLVLLPLLGAALGACILWALISAQHFSKKRRPGVSDILERPHG